MTEEEWVNSTESAIREAVRKLGPRRSRLLASACCRLLDAFLVNPSAGIASYALDAVELFADTGKSKAAIKRARQEVRKERYRLHTTSPLPTIANASASSALWAIEVAATENISYVAVIEALTFFQHIEVMPALDARRRLFPAYFDIVGNPFRPVAFSPAWRTSTAVAIARGMYKGRDFSAMPILADALQDAGCDHAAVLDHCREPGTHVRCCWVVDLVLGKA